MSVWSRFTAALSGDPSSRVKVHVLVKGRIGETWMDVDRTFSLPAGATLGGLLDTAGAQGIELREAVAKSPHLAHTLMVNGERCPLADNERRVLADGDQVYLLAPLAGGLRDKVVAMRSSLRQLAGVALGLPFLVACGSSDDAAPPSSSGASGAGQSAQGGTSAAGGSSPTGGGGTSSGAGTGGKGTAGASGKGSAGAAGSSSAGGPGDAGHAGSAGAKGGAGGASGAGTGGGAGGAAEILRAYVGAGDDQIHVFRVDVTTGDFTPEGAYPGGAGPSFLSFTADHHRAYATNENGGALAAFSVDAASGALTSLGTTSDDGGPTFVLADAAGAFVMSAEYGGGTARVFPVLGDGSLGAVKTTVSPGKNAHAIHLDPSGAFAFVPCLGSSYVAQYRFDKASLALTPGSPPTVATSSDPAETTGPRHLAFHPSAPFAFVLNELDSSISTMSFDAALGTLSFVGRVAMATAGIGAAGQSAAEIVVHPSGKLVFASNRGKENSVVVFSVDPMSGKLTLADRIDSMGKTPRSIALYAPASLLVVANQGSDDLVSFRFDAQSGKLTPLHTAQVGAAATFVGLVKSPPLSSEPHDAANVAASITKR